MQASSDISLYDKGTKVWLPHCDYVWQIATVEKAYKLGDNFLRLRCSEEYDDDNDVGGGNKNTEKDGEFSNSPNPGSLIALPIKPDGSNLPPLRNPTILIGLNDLTSMSYLHEPAVLYNLRVRFCDRQTIYTYCGIILVAINPYADLPLYGPNIIQMYRGRVMGELEPHIFAVAEEAYSKLEREKCDLSIIVSGESGAGKTVSAKYIMRYFAAVSGSELETQIERKVLASSPILEAFGNAKTKRNDNSSRFGKFTKLLFSNNMGLMNLIGGTIHTYLLEKSRVVFQMNGERNYHIFYQLCSSKEYYKYLYLDHSSKYQYLNGGSTSPVEGVCEQTQFQETLKALNILGFDKKQISDILKILSAILHIGNIRFTRKCKTIVNDSNDYEGCDIIDDFNFNIIGEILMIDVQYLRKWLLMRKIESANDSVLIPNNLETSQSIKDALSKHIYAKLFQYIVTVINRSLNPNDQKLSIGFIGVLDIYGFETFTINSFEQFCINYANEKLQQQYNQHVFKLEQEEYLKEGIPWTNIDFCDNQSCIDLIESKLGILDLLDEECRMPMGSDKSWAQKINERCSKYKCFEKSRFGNYNFFIRHFSDVVEYDVRGFLEKNRDNVSKELMAVIYQSRIPLCKQLMELEDYDSLMAEANSKLHSLSGHKLNLSTSSQKMNSLKHQRSVGSQFRQSLSALIETLHSTAPHYVRCIKPNDQKMPFKWEPAKIIQQLRACGVLETVRLSAAGFPSRWLYADFCIRYQLLCPRSQVINNSVKDMCHKILNRWILDKEKYRFGKTQLFFRAGQVAFLEQIRSNIRRKYIITVQAILRGFICRRRYASIRRTALLIQKYSRGLLARRRYEVKRQEMAATIIGKYARGWLVRHRYKMLRNSVCGIQQYARGMLARKHFREAILNYRITLIQKYARGFLARRKYKNYLNNVIKCQAAVRRFLAKRRYKLLKAEAKTILHMENRFKGLENKIFTMQQRIDTLNNENTKLRNTANEIKTLKEKLETKKHVENSLQEMQGKVKERNMKVAKLSKQLDDERDEKMQLLEEAASKEEEWETRKQLWGKENKELRAELSELIDRAKETIKNVIEQTKLEQDSSVLQLAYQKSLETCKKYENENSFLKEEIRKLSLNNFLESEKVHYDSNTNIEDDAGYSSNKNTLESQMNNMKNTLTTSMNSNNIDNIQKSIEIDNNNKFYYKDITTLDKESNNSNSKQQLLECETKEKDINTDINATSKYNENYTTTILRLKNLLIEEKRKLYSLQKQLEKTSKRRNNIEDTIRVNELEVENEMLRSDYDLLRQSIRQGAQLEELEKQHRLLHNEIIQRREECIQLKVLLHQYAFILKENKSEQNTAEHNYDLSHLRDNELIEAFEAQKVVNRQLESELHALTIENNAHLADLAKQIDELRTENVELYNILHVNMDKVESSNDLNGKTISNSEVGNNSLELQQSNLFLRHELHKTMQQYARVQEELNISLLKFESMHKRSEILALKLYKNSAMPNKSSKKDKNQNKDDENSSTITADLLDDLGYVDNSVSYDENDINQQQHLPQNQDSPQSQTESNASKNNEVVNCICSLDRIDRSSRNLIEYQGVLKFKSEDLDAIVDMLITDLTLRMASTYPPGFSAYLIFMCIRYTDLINSDTDVRELLSKFVKHVKKVQRTPHVTEYRVLWLVNSITLLNLLKQYGDVDEYMQFNTKKQNKQQLKNFNLKEYRRVIHEIILQLYQALIQQIESVLEPYIVPAILDNDEIQRYRRKQAGGSIRSHFKKLKNTNSDKSDLNMYSLKEINSSGIALPFKSTNAFTIKCDNQKPTNTYQNSIGVEDVENEGNYIKKTNKVSAWKQLLGQLNHFYNEFEHYGLDKCYGEQIIQQIMYYICAISINCLMLRGDICGWQTGMIIRYNLGYIENWVKEKKLSQDVLTPIIPLTEVSQLLQSRKSENDVQTICDLCSKLNTSQVMKIMKSYKLDDYENAMSNKFLEKLSTKLKERPSYLQVQEFTMDQNLIYPLQVVFKYSDQKLENIELPIHLQLEGLLTRI